LRKLGITLVYTSTQITEENQESVRKISLILPFQGKETTSVKGQRRMRWRSNAIYDSYAISLQVHTLNV
jgi:hypothetical protein